MRRKTCLKGVPLNLTIVLAVTFFGPGCFVTEPKSELEKLPPLTQSGNNTFGCLVDGKAIWLESNMDLTCVYIQDLDLLMFSARSASKDQGITLVINAPFNGAPKVGTIELDHLTDSIYGLFSVWHETEVNMGFQCEYDTRIEGTICELEITRLDFFERVFSGRFTFHGAPFNGCEAIEVLEGRFDAKFQLQK